MLFGKVEMIAEFRWGWISPWIASVLGIVSGNAIGKFTEYYTDTKYSPVKSLVKFATEGEAFLVSKGDALGFRSGMLPVLMIALSLILSYNACGVYGIAIAAVGMLSFVGVTVSIDAFGPIADNAGGFAESCHLGEEVRAITDQLDAVGNTTAAIGKGMAIGSAAFATLSLLFSYVGSYMTTGELTLNIINIYSMTGAMIGGALVSFFCAILTDNTIDSAYKMADEGDRQLSIPGVLEGTVLPDYSRVIAMAARSTTRRKASSRACSPDTAKARRRIRRRSPATRSATRGKMWSASRSTSSSRRCPPSRTPSRRCSSRSISFKFFIKALIAVWSGLFDGLVLTSFNEFYGG